MVEKPFALTVADASRVLARAEALGRRSWSRRTTASGPSERTVRKLIADGAIGRLDGATLIDRRHMPSRTEGPWLAKIEYPQLQEVAIHHFDSPAVLLRP
jgi:predicted dehydrogenase